jgi:hypothetical protein
MAAPTVRFYSGHKRSVRPVALTIDGREHHITSVLRSEVIEDYATRCRRRVFLCAVGKNLWRITLHDDQTCICVPVRPAALRRSGH